MRKAFAAAAAMALWALPAQSQQQTAILIFGGDDHRVFLGCLNCSELAPGSIRNALSPQGWNNALGLWSVLGPYKSPLSGQSACNPLTQDAPVLVDAAGTYYGRLTINPLAAGSICGMGGSPDACSLLKAFCSRN